MARAAQKKPIVQSKRGTQPADTLLGQRLRARRMEMKMSQAELGDKLGVSFQQVQKYEKGVNRVGASRLQQIAHLLETDIAYFIDDIKSGKARPPSKLTAFLATKDGLDVVEAMMKLPSVHIRGIVALARTLDPSR
ncbi:helix-turn-helix domain-containing protein [Bradyrhizobium sp. USDA 4508]